MKAIFLLFFLSGLAAIFWLSISGTKVAQQLYNPPPNTHTKLIFTGDVMLGRTVMRESLEKNHPVYPFLKVADTLRDADIALINLENPIMDNCAPHETGTIFCSDPKMVIGLTHSGVDVANLANNHTLNYGKNGLELTKKYLTFNNIAYTGGSDVVIKKVNGTTFGFLGFEKSQLNSPKLTIVESDLIKQTDSQVDVLVVSMHWGVEYKDKASEGQRKLARELVALGADVIVGHHPHWVQDMEKIDGKPVYYSLGNFVFDQMWSEQTRKGLVMRLTFDGKNLVNEEQLPIYMQNWAQPDWVTK